MPRSLQVARGQPLVAVQSETTDPGCQWPSLGPSIAGVLG